MSNVGRDLVSLLHCGMYEKMELLAMYMYPTETNYN